MSLLVETISVPTVKRWTKREYNQLVDAGGFEGQRVFLYRGDILQMPPQHHPHAYPVMMLTSFLVQAFGPKYRVRVQLPFDAPGPSMPEPDALVCTIEQGKRRPHPNTGVLVVEVSDSSLALDHEKAAEYAAAGVPEYWIIDVNARQVEVYRRPEPSAGAVLGFAYQDRQVVAADVSLAPVSSPISTLKIADFLA